MARSVGAPAMRPRREHFTAPSDPLVRSGFVQDRYVRWTVLFRASTKPSNPSRIRCPSVDDRGRRRGIRVDVDRTRRKTSRKRPGSALAFRLLLLTPSRSYVAAEEGWTLPIASPNAGPGGDPFSLPTFPSRRPQTSGLRGGRLGWVGPKKPEWKGVCMPACIERLSSPSPRSPATGGPTSSARIASFSSGRYAWGSRTSERTFLSGNRLGIFLLSFSFVSWREGIFVRLVLVVRRSGNDPTNGLGGANPSGEPST